MKAVACDDAVRALRQAGLAPGTMDVNKQDRAGTLTAAVLKAIQQPCREHRPAITELIRVKTVILSWLSSPTTYSSALTPPFFVHA